MTATRRALRQAQRQAAQEWATRGPFDDPALSASTAPGGMGRHRPDLLSGFFGLAFLIIGLSSLAGSGGVDAGLVVVTVAVVAGIGLMLSTPRRANPARPASESTPLASDRLLTPDALRDDDRAWFGLDVPLSEVEREIQAAVEAEEAKGAAQHGHPPAEESTPP